MSHPVHVPDPEDIPDEQRERDQWLMWDTSEDKPRAPLNEQGRKASWTDPDEWMSFERAREIASEIAIALALVGGVLLLAGLLFGKRA